MFKVKAIQRISSAKIIPILKEIIENEGFRFKKGKSNFEREADGFTQIIHASGMSLDAYQTNGEKYFIGKFTLVSKVELLDFAKWSNLKLSKEYSIDKEIANYHFYIIVPYSDFSYDDYAYGIQPHNYKERTFDDPISDHYNRNHLPIETLKRDLKTILFDLNDWTNYQKIYDSRPENAYISYDYLLHFMGKEKEAKEVFLKKYKQAMEEYNKATEIESRQHACYRVMQKAKILEELYAEKHNVPQLEAPFATLPSKNEYLGITPNYHYKEILRLDTTLLDTREGYLNDVGDFLLNPLNGGLSVFNKKGERILELDSHFWGRFNHREHRTEYVLKGTNWFASGRTIIKENGQVLQLEIPADYPPDFVKLSTCDLTYNAIDKEFYLLLYSYKSKKSFLLTYSETGGIKSAKTINTGIPAFCVLADTKRIIARNWETRENTVWDFEGTVVHEFKSGTKNYLLEVSRNGNYAVSYSWNSSSNLFNLDNGTKKSIKTHLTTKAYKEAFFNLSNDNYGIKQMAFSPDEKYAVGGGYAGKYVVWTLPAARMIELIPSANVLKKLSWAEGKSGESEEIEYPYLAEFEGKKHLYNEGNSIQRISFLQNGEYFLTHTDKGIMVWDRYFNNINWVEGEEKLEAINGSR